MKVSWYFEILTLLLYFEILFENLLVLSSFHVGLAWHDCNIDTFRKLPSTNGKHKNEDDRSRSLFSLSAVLVSPWKYLCARCSPNPKFQKSQTKIASTFSLGVGVSCFWSRRLIFLSDLLSLYLSMLYRSFFRFEDVDLFDSVWYLLSCLRLSTLETECRLSELVLLRSVVSSTLFGLKRWQESEKNRKGFDIYYCTQNLIVILSINFALSYSRAKQMRWLHIFTLTHAKNIIVVVSFSKWILVTT